MIRDKLFPPNESYSQQIRSDQIRSNFNHHNQKKLITNESKILFQSEIIFRSFWFENTCKIRVNLLSRYGIWLCFSFKAVTTFPRANKEELILLLSVILHFHEIRPIKDKHSKLVSQKWLEVYLRPVFSVFRLSSLPARSIRCNLLKNTRWGGFSSCWRNCYIDWREWKKEQN